MVSFTLFSCKLLLIQQLFLHNRRITRGHAIRRHIFGNHRTCADYRALADGNATHNNHTPADPNIVFNHNRANVRIAFKAAGFRVEFVVGRIKQAFRPHHHVLAEGQAVADFAIDADTRIVADYRIRKNISAFFDIDVFADVWGNARSQSGAEFCAIRPKGLQ